MSIIDTTGPLIRSSFIMQMEQMVVEVLYEKYLT